MSGLVVEESGEPWPMSEEQIKFPLASVVSLPPLVKPEQRLVPKVNPPAVILSPFAMVEVAVPVVLIAKTFSPPANVEVAVVDVALKIGAAMSDAYNPPAIVEVAVPVAMSWVIIKGLVDVTVPEMVSVPPNERSEPLMVTEEFWRKAFVIEPLGSVTDEVAVKAPTVRMPAVVEPMYAWPAANIVEVALANV